MSEFGTFRRSDTFEQEQHERDILARHYPEIKEEEEEEEEEEQPPHSHSHNGTHADNGVDKAVDGHHSSLTGKMKGLWKNKIKPAFPEAITDLSIIGNTLKTEAAVRKDSKDVVRFPEIRDIAHVRKGLDLCPEEAAFLVDRKLHVRNHFAKYLGLNPADVHPDDVPTVAFGGSGGGFRAMIAFMGYSEEMKRAGLWDLFTYFAGVSGSCWALAAYYTFGDASWGKLIEHCKTRLSPYHPLSAEAIRTVLTAHGGSYATLGPLVQKYHSGLMIVAMDLYSVFTTGYLFLHDNPALKGILPGRTSTKEVAGKEHSWYKWSSATNYLKGGAEPLPIMTAIRHERPWKDWVDKEHPFREHTVTATEHSGAKDAWFQWFEMTPFEIGCDEIEAWVPTWGFGRKFSEGKSVQQLPEQSLALLLGLCTSAPAGPLTSYLSTISRNLPPGFIGNTIHELASKIAHFWGKHETQVFQDHHPLHACNEHNYTFHLSTPPAGQPRPAGLENSPRVHLIDSGMDNNCPTYVLLYPARKVDVILNMDASSDVQKDTFQERVDQIGSRRGLKFTKRHPDLKAGSDAKDPERFKGLYAQIYDGVLAERPGTVVDSYGHDVTNPPAPVCHQECTMVYLPVLPNEKAVPDFDPSTAKFSGSYNLVWTPEQVEMLVKVCGQNFRDGEDEIRMALMDAYMRKKAKREGLVKA